MGQWVMKYDWRTMKDGLPFTMKHALVPPNNIVVNKEEFVFYIE